MMAWSTKGSNQRPDTLMQDRKSANPKKSSCNARPDHTSGSKREFAILGPGQLSPAADIPPRKLRSGNGMDRPRSRPQRFSECAGGLSGKEHHHAPHDH